MVVREAILNSPTNAEEDAGYLYALSNAHIPDLLKIGRTGRSPDQRARELSTTGVPGRFRVEWQSKRLLRLAEAEQAAHAGLARYRLRGSEFFGVALTDALPILKDIEARFLDRVVEEERIRVAREREAERLRRQRELDHQRLISSRAVSLFNIWRADPDVQAVQAKAEHLSHPWETGSASGKLGCFVSIIVVGIWSVALLGPAGVLVLAVLAMFAKPLVERRFSRMRSECWQEVRSKTPEPIWRQLEEADWHIDNTFLQRLADAAIERDRLRRGDSSTVAS